MNDIIESGEHALTACEPGAGAEPYDLTLEDDDEDEEFDEIEDVPSDYEVYMEVYQYVIGMAGYLVNQETLLETYPVLKKHRMFLHGAVLDCHADKPAAPFRKRILIFGAHSTVELAIPAKR